LGMDATELKQVAALRAGRNIAMTTLRRMLGDAPDDELRVRFEVLLAEATPTDLSGVRDIARASAREAFEGVMAGKWP
jgi:outer membrane protein TolC